MQSVTVLISALRQNHAVARLRRHVSCNCQGFARDLWSGYRILFSQQPWRAVNGALVALRAHPRFQLAPQVLLDFGVHRLRRKVVLLVGISIEVIKLLSRPLAVAMQDGGSTRVRRCGSSPGLTIMVSL